MAKKSSDYDKLVKKMMARAKKKANPALAKMNKAKMLKSKASSMSDKMTSPERVFSKMMKELGVEIVNQKVIKNKIYDFYIPSKNMVIEVDGDYWHANPLIYEGKELNKIQLKNVRNDKKKDSLAIGYGFLIERVWEHDLHNNYEEQKERFRKILK